MNPLRILVGCETSGVVRRAFAARIPLDQVDLRTDEEAGQGMLMLCDAGCGL